MFILGRALTVTVIEAMLTQPTPFVPVTEYDVDTAGLTVILADVAPLLHT
jgi:hypothetical protein